MEKNEQLEKKRKKQYTTLGVIVLIILLILLAFSCQHVGEEVPDNQIDISLDPNATDEERAKKDKEVLQEELNRKVAEGMINISMNMTPVFENGTSKGNLMIMNEEINNHTQVIEIYLDETNELIYRSGGIPVGSRVEKAPLMIDLEAGEYPATAYFLAVDTATSQVVGKAGAKIKISVLN